MDHRDEVMQYHAKYTNEFNKQLERLRTRGGRGTALRQKALAAMSDWQMYGRISHQQTHHGESRLPNVTKYDLGDGYRMVVQRPSREKGVSVFLFHWRSRGHGPLAR